MVAEIFLRHRNADVFFRSTATNTGTFAFTLSSELDTFAVLRLLGTISGLKKFRLVGLFVIFAFSPNITQLPRTCEYRKLFLFFSYLVINNHILLRAKRSWP